MTRLVRGCRGRTDLLLIWPRGGAEGPGVPADRFAVECKVFHGSLERTITEWLAQTAGYMDRCAAHAGHLVIFDRREGKVRDEKVSGATKPRVDAGS